MDFLQNGKMIPINNSDTAWLIVSDYNQENGKYHEELRKDIISPKTNKWVYDFVYPLDGVGGDSNKCVGNNTTDSLDNCITNSIYGSFVGGSMHEGSFVGGCRYVRYSN